jgi:hypothetical protein
LSNNCLISQLVQAGAVTLTLDGFNANNVVADDAPPSA